MIAGLSIIPHFSSVPIPVQWLAVLCGPSGSGKSTFANRLSQASGCIIASTDAMRLALFGGRYPDKESWSRSRDLVYALVDDVVIRGLRAGFSVVVDGVNATPTVRHRFIRHAPHGRSLILGFLTAFDNDDVWAGRGYDSRAAAEIRGLHRAEFVPPSALEARVIRIIGSTRDADELLAGWSALSI
jgi:hypothetical protein